MSIKEHYEQYCNKAKEHLKIVTKNNIPYNMCWLMFFDCNYEKFYDKEKLNLFVEENQINKYDFVDIRYRTDPYQVFWGNKLSDIQEYHTKSNYFNNITFDLFGDKQDCFWTKPSIDKELFDDYISGEISERQFIKITMRNQQKCR